MLSIVFTFYQTLDLDHLERALYSLSRQTELGRADELVFVDNNTVFHPDEIRAVVEQYRIPMRLSYHFQKHGNPDRRHSWSANYGIRAADNEMFFFTRADYILMEDALERMTDECAGEGLTFASGWCWQMACERGGTPYEAVPSYEAYAWRRNVRFLLQHTHAHRFHETDKDAGVFATTKEAIALGGWYDEAMISFGYQQSTLQRRMRNAGVCMTAIQDYLFCHQHHEADRDFNRAHAEYVNSRGG
jgi:hypothetical protein